MTESQRLTDNIIEGPVVQALGDNITVTIGRAPYRVGALEEPRGISLSTARSQPSKLLLARYEAVPFTGRATILERLGSWLDAEAFMAVRLVHGAGGEGKTRLATHFARSCAAAGWSVRCATHEATGRQSTELEADTRGLLVVVDYAERWAASALRGLLADMHALAARLPNRTPVRALLLARDAGFWWAALEHRLDADLGVPAEAERLPPLGTENDPHEIFTAARDHFAELLQIPDVSGISPPGGLDGHALTLHMAALTAVDAQHRGVPPPADPHRASAYLIKRESAHWHDLHTRSEAPMATSPREMSRSVYAAILAGPLPRGSATEMVQRLGLTSSTAEADRIIDDHRAHHPPALPGSVLEPLRPDRLAEDYLALVTPGHGIEDPIVDDWTLGAPERALAPGGDAAVPAWAPRALSRLIEATGRWPHLAESVLNPLLLDHPELALAADGAALVRLAGLDALDLAVLEAVEPLLPAGRHTDLDLAAAAVTQRLFDDRVRVAKNPEVLAQLDHTLAWRLALAGRFTAALAASERSVGSYRDLMSAGAPAFRRELAAALTNHGLILLELDRLSEATGAGEEAVSIYRALDSAEPLVHEEHLALALANLAKLYWEGGNDTAAAGAAEEAARLFRPIVWRDRDLLPHLATALSNQAVAAAGRGEKETALALAEEVAEVYCGLAEIEPRKYALEYSLALDQLAELRWEAGLPEKALESSDLAFEAFDRTRPTGRADLRVAQVNALINRSLILSDLGRHAEALALSATAVEVATSGVDDIRFVVPGMAVPVAHSLNTFAGVRLAAGTDLEEALTAIDKALTLYAGAHPVGGARRNRSEGLADSVRTRAELLAALKGVTTRLSPIHPLS